MPTTRTTVAPVYGVPVCGPLWTDQAPGNFVTNIGPSAVSVANGYAYVGGANGSGQGTLFAFDQNGVSGCSMGTCNPVFQTSGGPGFPAPLNLAVSGNTVYGIGETPFGVACLPSVEPDVAARRAAQELFGTPGTSAQVMALAPSVTPAPRTSPTEWYTWASSWDWEQVEQVGGLTPITAPRAN